MPININKDISQIPFTFLDLETTGLEPEKGARVIEIGAVKIKGSQVLAEYNNLVNIPAGEISEFITELTGIKTEDIRGQKFFAKIALEVINFCSDSVIVAHNAPFDKKFLYHELDLAGFETPVWTWIDTVKLARIAWPNFENHKLQTIARQIRIDPGNAHRAKDDAIVCSKVFFAAVEKIKERMSLRRLLAIEGTYIDHRIEIEKQCRREISISEDQLNM